jgi:nucleotide-binding universal stress UspA family protein
MRAGGSAARLLTPPEPDRGFEASASNVHPAGGAAALIEGPPMSETEEAVRSTRVQYVRDIGTIVVHAEPELAASHTVEAATRLARAYGARLIGLGAEAMEPITFSDATVGLVMAEVLETRRRQIDERLQSAEAAFRRDAAGVETDWRSLQAFPKDALIQAARSADLIVVGARAKGSTDFRTANPADVVMSAGRPVLIVPENGRHLQARRVVVAWKDVREARRAVADALPFLQRAEEVIVQAVCSVRDRELAAFQTKDVVAALERHGVVARPNVIQGGDADVVDELDRIAELNGADLIVAGAYGHARLAEWIFGGVTDHLLHRPRRFILTSH